MRRFRRTVSPLFLAMLLSACGGGDPVERVLAERAEWRVTLTGWLQTESEIQATVRVTAPSKAKLDRLSLKLRMLDAAGGVLRDVWQSIDVSELRRGSTGERILRVAQADPVEGLALLLEPNPSGEDRARLVELQGLGD